MGFNYPNSNSESEVLIPPNVQYAISVDGINNKTLPDGTTPYVVYRIGDGTIHPEGWENILGNKYLDFYMSNGAKGAKGDKGEAGISAFTQAVANGYSGTQAQFYLLLENTGTNMLSAQASANASAISETNASNSEIASQNSASIATTQASNASNSASIASSSASNASNSATSASTSASKALTSEINSATSASSAAISANNALSSSLVLNAYNNLDWAGFTVNSNSELLVDIFNGATSTPSLVDGDFIITY